MYGLKSDHAALRIEKVHRFSSNDIHVFLFRAQSALPQSLSKVFLCIQFRRLLSCQLQGVILALLACFSVSSDQLG